MTLLLDSPPTASEEPEKVPSYSYGAFGEGGPQDFGFVGLFGALSDVHIGTLNWNRWLDRLNGSWLSVDPIGIAGGVNTFRYAGNSVTGFVDPLGLQRTCVYRRVKMKYYWPGEANGDTTIRRYTTDAKEKLLGPGSYACAKSKGVACNTSHYYPYGSSVTVNPDGGNDSPSGTIVDYGTEGDPDFTLEQWSPKPKYAPEYANVLICWNGKKNCFRPKDAFDLDPNKPLPNPTTTK